MHVFGPFDRFPVAERGAYAPPVADRQRHRMALDALGFDNALLIQPSLYGTDLRALLHAVTEGDGRLRAVGSCDRSTSSESLGALRAQGMVGLRFVGMRGPDGGSYPGTQGLDVFAELQADMHAAGMHAQVWADLETCAGLAVSGALQDMDLVFDHLAGLGPDDGPGSYNFDRLVAAMVGGHVWVKLAYLRRSARPLDYGDLQRPVTALVESAPDQVIWGSDWPFVRMDSQPEAAFLIDRLHQWLGDEAFARCVRDNPARLLGSGKSIDG